MPNTATLLTSTPYRLVYLLTGDGTVAGPTIASATLIADAVAGPLEDLLSATYANQAAMRFAFLTSNPARCNITYLSTPTQVTAEQNLIVVDVDVDAITAARPEINIGMSDTTGQVGYLEIEYLQTTIR
jgi:hypothetical protein